MITIKKKSLEIQKTEAPICMAKQNGIEKESFLLFHSVRYLIKSGLTLFWLALVQISNVYLV